MEKVMTFLGFNDEDEEDAREQVEGAEPRRRSPVFSLHTQRQWEIIVLDPRSLDEARRGADAIKSRRPLFVNLQHVEQELARRVVDFLSGATYALDGHMQRIGEEMFLFTPGNIAITADVLHPHAAALFPE